MAEAENLDARMASKIELWPLDKLRPYDRNPRTHDADQVAQIQASIIEFGFNNPILVDSANGIIAGHGRLQAAQALGMERVPVVVLDHLSDAQRRAYVIADNKLAELAGWDDELLTSELDALSEEGFDIDVIGFSAEELEELGTGKEKFEFRPGEKDVKDSVDYWRDVEAFYDCPDDVRAEIEAREIIVVEFSGGKDSTGVALWAAHNFPDKKVLLTFVDPGVEFPGMTLHIADVAKHLGVEYQIIHPQLDWWTFWIEKGSWPSLIFRDCAHKFIHGPWGKWVRGNCPPEKTVVMTGSRAEEAVRGSKKTDRSSLASLGADQEKFFSFHPCFNVTKPVLEAIIEASGVPIWEGYAMGFVRTACWCCPGQRGTQALALAKNFPGLADYIRKLERERLGVLRPTDSNGGRSFDDVLRAGMKEQARADKKKAGESEDPPAGVAAQGAAGDDSTGEG